MADKKMVSERARVQVQRVLGQLEAERGNLRLAMLMPTELSDRWNLVVSAPWMDSLGSRSVIKDLTSRLLSHVDKGFLSAIERVSVVQGSDPFVRGITDLVQSFLGVNASSHEGGFHLWDTTLEGRRIPEAFVFVANAKANGKPARSSTIAKSAHR